MIGEDGCFASRPGSDLVAVQTAGTKGKDIFVMRESLTRRKFIQFSSAGAIGGAASGLLARRGFAFDGVASQGRSVILIVNSGGPSQLDTFDPKPDAGAEIRGPFAATSTKIPGVAFSELFPKHARIADKFSLVRSCYHTFPATHEVGKSLLLSGAYSRSLDRLSPTVGAVASSLIPSRTDVPSEVSLCGSFRPETHDRDPIEFRLAMDDVLDIRREPSAVRDRYGRTSLGESFLRARRCVEAGVLFVTLSAFPTVFNQPTWDVHGNSPYTSMEELRNVVAPMHDRAYVALIEDLQERGLLESTLVCGLAEFGRTPKMNSTGGRDHWTHCFTTSFAGGGVQGGRIVGRSDAIGAFPADRPVTPQEITATIYHALGIAEHYPHQEIDQPNVSSSPITARPIHELF